MKPTSVHRPEYVALITLLKEYRLKAGLTQVAVAEKLGISQTGVSDIEVGKDHGRRIGGYTISFARIDGADR